MADQEPKQLGNLTEEEQSAVRIAHLLIEGGLSAKDLDRFETGLLAAKTAGPLALQRLVRRTFPRTENEPKLGPLVLEEEIKGKLGHESYDAFAAHMDSLGHEHSVTNAALNSMIQMSRLHKDLSPVIVKKGLTPEETMEEGFPYITDKKQREGAYLPGNAKTTMTTARFADEYYIDVNALAQRLERPDIASQDGVGPKTTAAYVSFVSNKAQVIQAGAPPLDLSQLPQA